MEIKSVKKKKGSESTVSASKPKVSFQVNSVGTYWGLFGMIAIVMSVIAFFFFISPLFKKVGPGREFDVATAQATLDIQKKTYTDLQKLGASYDKISDKQIDLLSRILPEQKDIPEIISQLEAIARQSGVQIVSMNIAELKEQEAQSARQRLQSQTGQKTASTTEIQKLNLQLDVAAHNYESMKRFIESLQSHVRVMDVQRFAYSPDNQSHTVNVITYYQP